MIAILLVSFVLLFYYGGMRSAHLTIVVLLTLFIVPFAPQPAIGQEGATVQHRVEPGDTWQALARRYQSDRAMLQSLNRHLNPQREPTIGSVVNVPNNPWRTGVLADPDRSLLEISIRNGQNLWGLAAQNGFEHPYQPRLGQTLWIDGAALPKQLPIGLTDLELSHIPGRAGEGMGGRGRFDPGYGAVREISLGTASGQIHYNTENSRFLLTLATGAFFFPGEPELTVKGLIPRYSPSCSQNLTDPACQRPILWSQPLRFEDKQWTFNDITLTGQAAQIDQQAIADERAMLFELWLPASPDLLYTGPFAEPVNGYLYHSSFYGARRSYNGGPYSTYHEGLDFAAYRGSEVFSPATGQVVLAEQLYVRGGAVIIDHGLGIYSGYYHLDEVLVTPGSWVESGALLGRVGSTGLSTGPHLHWDLLLNGVWVDPFAWREQKMGCWFLTGWREAPVNC